MVDNRIERLGRQGFRFGEVDPLADLARQLFRQLALQRGVRPQHFAANGGHARQLGERVLLVIGHAQHPVARHKGQGVALAGWPGQQTLGSGLCLLAELLAQGLQFRAIRRPLL